MSYVFNPFTGTLDVVDISDLSGYFKLDQTTPQTVSGGMPVFSGGINLNNGGQTSPSVRVSGTGSALCTADMRYEVAGPASNYGYLDFVNNNGGGGGLRFYPAGTAFQAMYSYVSGSDIVLSGAGTNVGFQLKAQNGNPMSGNGANVTMQAGSGVTFGGSGTGGHAYVYAGNGTGTNRAGGDVYIRAGVNTGTGIPGTVYIQPGGDTSDYVTFKTVADQTTMNFVGQNGRITADSGTIDFDDENITTKGYLSLADASHVIKTQINASGYIETSRDDIVFFSTANNNVIFGTGALSEEPNNNSHAVCIGEGAGAYCKYSSGNIFIGDHSGYGSASLYQSSSSNIAIGSYTLYNIQNGASYNTIMGYYAGASLTTADRNIFIGPYAGYRQTTTSDLLIIDNRARSDIAEEASSSIIFGVMAAAPEDQTLTFNANTTISGDLVITGDGTAGQSFIASGLIVNEDGGNTDADDLRAETVSNANALVVDASADEINLGVDTVFVGTGSGLPFGSMYGDNIDVTIDITIQDAYTELASGLTGGSENLTTFQNDHEILITKPGKYMVNWSLSLATATANDEIEGEIMVNGTATETGGSAHVVIANSNKPQTLSATGILTLAVDDVVSMSAKNNTSTADILVNHASLTLLMVGA